MSRHPKTWPVIEHDQNRGPGRIFDIVTKNHAEDLAVGDEVIVVCLDYESVPRDDGTDRRVLDFGQGFIAVVTEVRALDSGEYLVRARVGRRPWWQKRSRR